MIDEDSPRPIGGAQAAMLPLGAALDLQSVEQLQARIAALETEIQRCRNALAAKAQARHAAEAFFRPRDGEAP